MSTSPPPRRGRPPRHDRDTILDAASRMLVYRGYANTRYRDVAQASGVPVGSLQHHFPSLDELRREALKHKVRLELRELEQELAPIADPWQRIRRIIMSSVSLDAERRRGGWVLWLEYWHAAAHDEELAADSAEVDHAWLRLAAQSVADGVEQGMFHLDGTPYEAAIELHALLDGLGVALALPHAPERATEAITLVERAARRMLFAVR